MTRLGTLTSALRPPAKPTDHKISAADWASLEQSLQTPLPDGYKAFLESYGTGTISGYIRVLNPFSKTDDWFTWVASTIATDAHARAADARSRWPSTRQLPAPPFPAQPGLLPFASWGAAAVLHFWTRGKPNEWPIVWTPIGSNDHLVFELTLPKFLDGLLRGRVVDPALGVEYPMMKRGATFLPARSSKQRASTIPNARDVLSELVTKNQGRKFVPYAKSS